MKSSIKSTKKHILVLCMLVITLFALLLLPKSAYAVEVDAFTYNGKSLNYVAGHTKAAIENDIKASIVISDGDFTVNDIQFNYSLDALSADTLNFGAHTVTLVATVGEKVAVPVVLDLFGIKDFVDFKGDVTSATDYAFSTGVAPVDGDLQPNTIQSWVFLPSAPVGTAAKGSELGYVIGSGAGGSGPNIFAIAVYGTGAWGLFWNNKLYPTVSSPGATGGITTVPAMKLPYDTWTHIASVRDKDAQVIRFYMDGELIYTTPVDANLGNDLVYSLAPASTKTIGVGKDGRTARNRRLGGSISTVSVLGSMRTEAEIQADMKAALNGDWSFGSDRWMHYDFNDQAIDLSSSMTQLEVNEGVTELSVKTQILESITAKDMIGRDVTLSISVPSNLVSSEVMVLGNGVVSVTATDLFGNIEVLNIDLSVVPVPVPTLTYVGKDLNFLAGKTKAELEAEILEKVSKLNSNADVEFEYSVGALANDLVNPGAHTVTISIPDVEPIVIELFVIKDFIDFSGDVLGTTNRAFSTGIIPVNGDPQPNSIETWIYLPQAPIGNGVKGSELGYVVGTGAGGSGPGIFSLAVYGTGAWGLYWNNALYPTVSSPSAATNPGTTTVPELVIPYEKWTHIASVRDKEAQVIRFYMNGELIYTTPATPNIGNDIAFSSAPSSKSLGIGKDGRTANNRKLGASLASVAVFSSARSQADIKADMNASLSGNWTFGEERWLWFDFSNQAMNFSFEGTINAISGISAATIQSNVAALASVTDFINRPVSGVTATIDPALVSEGLLVEGIGFVTFSATDLFGNTQTWTVEIEVSTPVPLLIYTGLRTLSYISGHSKADIEAYLISKTEVVNYALPIDFTFSANSLTNDLLNIGGFTVTMSIPDLEPIVIELYGLDNYISFIEDRTTVTDNAYSTGIIPKEQPNTIQAWIFVPSGLANNLIGYVTGNGAGGSGSETVALVVYGSGAFSYFWKGSLYPSISSVASGAVPSVPELSIPKDTWTHISVVRDKEAKIFRYYINAELIYTTPSIEDIGLDQNAELTSGGREYGIGKDGRTNLDRRLPGMLSTVAIFNVARTQEEIKADMLSAITQENMTSENDKLIYFANVHDVLNDNIAPTITFKTDAAYNAMVGDYNDDFKAFVEENLHIVDNNSFTPATYTINYNGGTNIFQQFHQAGVFTVIITVKDLSDNVATFEIELTVESDVDPNAIISLDITNGDQGLNVGSTLQLNVVKNPSTSTENVLWTSSNQAVAVVSNQGLVTAIGNGVAIITVKNADGSITDSVAITVSTVVVELVSITITEADQNLEIYKTLQLTAVKNPTDAAAEIIWESSNPSIAIVSGSGLVTAASAGEVVITAKNADGSIFDTITITVVLAAVPAPAGCAFDCATANASAVALAIFSVASLLGLSVLVFRRKF